MAAGIQRRSVMVSGHRTSVSVEDEFWDEFSAIAARRGMSLNALISEIDRARDGNLSSAVRLFVLRALKPADPAGHRSD
jgi:predicted DNA-binding ribbon-helix-helix protein